jgi:aconitase B
MEKKGKKSVFNGRSVEIEGLPDLKYKQAFELTDASATLSTAGCTITLNPKPIREYLKSNIILLKCMIAEGYLDTRTWSRRVANMKAWLEHTKCSPRVESCLECLRLLVVAGLDVNHRSTVTIDRAYCK